MVLCLRDWVLRSLGFAPGPGLRRPLAPSAVPRSVERMPRRTIDMLAVIGLLALSVIAVAGCGGASPAAPMPRPAAPVNLTVYIDNSSVSVSPSSGGAGAATF